MKKSCAEKQREKRIAKAEIYGLTVKQIKNLVNHQNRKTQLITQGYTPRPKGPPRKNALDQETRRKNELAELRMQVELLENLMYEAGRR